MFFTSTLKLEKKIGGPSTFYLKLIKDRRVVCTKRSGKVENLDGKISRKY